MARRWLLCWSALVISLVLCLTTSCSNRAAADESAKVNDLTGIGGDFTLTDHNGQRFQLQQERGKVGLLFFGYTFCTDACPVALARVKETDTSLGDKQQQVPTIF